MRRADEHRTQARPGYKRQRFQQVVAALGVDYLFVVRHGETPANQEEIDAGSLDYPLDKKGVKEVAYIAKTLAKCKISAVYCSPVFRAVQTAKILARPHKLKVKILEDLTEAKLKPKFVGRSGRHHILTTPEAFEETYEEVQQRMLRAVNFIRKEQSGNVIAVAHGDVIVALLDHVVERQIRKGKSYYVLHPNPGSLSIVNLKEEKPSLVLLNYHRKLFKGF